ncbi:gamma-aminobutyric acid receptor subunit rho-3 isoform X3 [Hydra vulgaris]|uniref:Gamma-aminobutyric acid receptor subunit rho-3 isoform X3 n=1 Tax=Hydra vulgaris TaxID=6087 RepID=A0ABM4CEV4_HYDVU
MMDNYILIELIITSLHILKASNVKINNENATWLHKQQIKNESNDEIKGTLPEVALQIAMKNYNKVAKPKGVVQVELDIRILSFDNLDESSMKYNMDFYFAQHWYDERLEIFPEIPDCSVNIVGKSAEDFWMPDTVFVNSKATNFHFVTVENRFTTVNLSNGMILHHARITATASCRMDFKNYPFDEQTCYLAIESYGYDQSYIVYKWYLNDDNSTNEKYIAVHDKEMANYDVTNAFKSYEKTPHHDSSFSSATAKFTFRRRREYFILQIYLPCAVIVAVTWVSFWIIPTAIPARCGILVTSLLTLITMLSITNASMPKVGYIKALDLYLFASLIFVFLALIEYIIVLNTSHKKKRKSTYKEGNLFIGSQLKSDYKFSVDFSKNIREKADLINDFIDYSKDATLLYQQLHTKKISQNERPEKIHIKCESQKLLNEKLKIKFKNRNSTFFLENEIVEVEIAPKDENISLSAIDYFARVFFPVLFISFNVFYWWFYYRN